MGVHPHDIATIAGPQLEHRVPLVLLADFSTTSILAFHVFPLISLYASFMIHGNHDDPGGESNLCAANILEARPFLKFLKYQSVQQVGGLCNYFGRHEDLEAALRKAEFSPITDTA